MGRKKTRKSTAGRPTVITAEVVRKLEEAFKIDATDEEACSYAGIGETAYYKRLKTDSKFADRIRNAQRYPFLIMKKVVVKAANDGDGKLALKWLQNRQRDLYHERVDQKVSGGLDDLIKAQEGGAPADVESGS